MSGGKRWIRVVALAMALGISGCSLETLEREMRSGGRDMARGLAQVGNRLESGLEGWGRDLRGRSSSRGSRSGGGPVAKALGSGGAAPGDGTPFARAVPGRDGFVKLPGRDHLPDVDVRGIPSGTRLDVPDPERPGAAIGFRVP